MFQTYLILLILIINIFITKAPETHNGEADFSLDVSNTIQIGSCDNKIFCNEHVLAAIKIAGIYTNIKEFLDMSIVEGDNVESIFKDFNEFIKKSKGNPSKYNILSFLERHFQKSTVIESWRPDDYEDTPKIISKIKNQEYKEMAQRIIDIWPRLGRKIKDAMLDSPDSHSLIYVPYGFIVPNGKLEEYYYWDSYWIVKGLLLSDMTQTVRGILNNFCYLLKKFGFIPNGGRIYYISHSHPPLLMKMVRDYLEKTNDLNWLKPNIPLLEQELYFWINKRFTTVQVNNKNYSLAHYDVNSTGPRPHKYNYDTQLASTFKSNADKEKLYYEIRCAAESGWDFSTRFTFNHKDNTFKDIAFSSVSTIIPADLNGILYGAFMDIAQMYSKIGQLQNKTTWARRAEELKEAINSVLWHEEDGIWYDYDLKAGKHSRFFACSNLVPLWTKVYDEDNREIIGKRISEYLVREGVLNHIGGIPATKIKSNEKWDFPNVYANLQYIIVHGLKDTGEKNALKLTRTIITNFLNACAIGFKAQGTFFERYDAQIPGSYGGGSDSPRSTGFGWTNGVVLDFIDIYTTSGCKKDYFNQNLRKIVFIFCVVSYFII